MKLHGQCFVVYLADDEIALFYIKCWNTCAYFVYFKSKKELNCDKFVDPNILGAARLVHSDPRIYRISFFLLDLKGLAQAIIIKKSVILFWLLNMTI